MSRNEIILGVVALVVVGFSLVVSLVIPRRRPDFPGNRLGLFTLACVLLVVAMVTTVELFGEEEAEEAEAAEVEAGEGEGEGEAPAEPEGEGGAGDAAAGEGVFASAGCGSCHTLEEAGSNGTVGPNLDESGISLEEAVAQIKAGGNGMPPYEGQLAEDEIQNVAAFVVESQGR